MKWIRRIIFILITLALLGINTWARLTMPRRPMWQMTISKSTD